MKRFALLLTAVLAWTVVLAQTLSIKTGQVDFLVPAAQAGDMVFQNAETMTIMNRTYNVADIEAIYIDNTDVADNTVDVSYDGEQATVRVAGNVAQYLDVSVRGGHVAIVQGDDLPDEITYTLSGRSDNGSFYMNGKLKASLRLDGVTLNNPDSAAINIRDGKRIAVELVDGTTSALTDGTGGQQKACFAVKGHTEFKGGGTLNLTGNSAHAFWGKEYVQLKQSVGTINVLGAVGDGFNVNQYFLQNGGTLTIAGVGDDGIQVSYKTDDDDNVIPVDEDEDNTGEVLIKGGTLTVSVTALGAKGIKAEGPVTINESKATTTLNVTATGGTEVDGTDLTGSSCLKSATAITIDGGTLTLKATGQGGRAILSDGTLDINGGVLTARAEGSNYGSSSNNGGRNFAPGGFGPGGGFNPGGGGFNPGGNTSGSGKNAKGIKAKGNLTITGGSINAYSASHEGIESKALMTITGGTVYVQASDDAINSSSNMTISGGSIYAYSSGNDGVDANGNMYIQGGVVVAFGAGGAEAGIDVAEQKSMYFTGGEIFGIGGRVDGSPSSTTGSQAYAYTSSSKSYSGYIVLADASGNAIYAVKCPTASYSGICLVSSASMVSGSSYKIGAASSVSGTEVNGFITAPTLSGMSSSTSVTARK